MVLVRCGRGGGRGLRLWVGLGVAAVAGKPWEALPELGLAHTPDWFLIQRGRGIRMGGDEEARDYLQDCSKTEQHLGLGLQPHVQA